MSKQTEAMKQALDALEYTTNLSRFLLNNEANIGPMLKADDAITALREALMSGTDGAEQPAQQDLPDLIAGALGVSRGTAYDMMREALKEASPPDPCCWPGTSCDAQQEPYAWMHTKIDDVFIRHRPADLRRHPDRWMALYKDPTPCQTCEALARTVMMDQTAHDISPSREWVGLTDEDKEFIAKRASVYDWHDYEVIEASEAKLKEKNT